LLGGRLPVDADGLKPYLEKFLKLHGVEFNRSGKFKCLFHAGDDTASAGIVPKTKGTQAYCFGCGKSGDIFTFAAHFYGLDEKRDFPEIKKRVAEELGRPVYEPPAIQKDKKPEEKPVTLAMQEAKAIYTSAAVTELGKFIFGDKLKEGAELKIEKVWPCLNEAGEVEFIEARFLADCFTDNKKRPCAVWWNGKRLKSKNNPHGLFGRGLLADNPEKPVLIVEGPKCQEAAKALAGFAPIAWNGGAQGQRKINFAPLKGRTVYIWPDDDEAGEKSARATAKLLHGIAKNIIIIRPLPEARTVKPKKADIVEALQVKTPEQLAEYILKHTPPAELPKSNDPYIAAGVFLAQMGFFKIYDKKSISFYSVNEEQPYNYGEIRDKFAEDKVGGQNPAKGAKMINNLDPVYPVYHLVKSFAYPPLYMGRNGNKNEYIINRWRGFAYPLPEAPPFDPDIEAEVEFVKGHIKNIVCGGNEADYEYFCKWLAHLFQRPDEKPGTAVFAHSDAHGTGKSLVFERLIPNMLGVGVTSVFTNKEQIAEKFNTWLFESLYVVFSEQSFYEHTENIKSWITEEYHNRRGMGADSQPDRSFARFVICTNKENAFKFEKTERRMFVLNVSDERLHDWPYFNRLGKAVKSAAVLDRMARFFSSIDISGFNPFDLPESQKKHELIEAEKHPVIEFFEMVIYGTDTRCKIKLCSEIDPEGKNYYENQLLYKSLKELGENCPGLYFIEQKRLYDHWRDSEGRNRKETMNRFVRIIKKAYIDGGDGKIEIFNKPIWLNGKTVRLPVIFIKKEFLDG
jgi:5S rRNA maturation endonuclease (ribonuclease M5)